MSRTPDAGDEAEGRLPTYGTNVTGREGLSMSDEIQGTRNEITADSQVAKIFEWRRGFNAMHLIDIGVQLGLFKAFAQSPGATAARIAEDLSLHPPYVETWCTTAYSFGLLEGQEDRTFQLAPYMDEILANAGHPRYLGGYVRLGTEFATEDHRYCLDAFKTGDTVPFQGRSHAFAEAVAEGTAGLQVLSARKLLPDLAGLKERLDDGGTILEIGCGTGRHLLQLTRAFPQALCVGVDIDPTGLEAARTAIEQAGIADRVTLIEGDVGTAVAEASVDAVVMIEVLHEIAPAIRQQVIDGCHRALRSGGWLLIVDETYPSTLADARRAEYLFPVQTGFEELTWGNVLPTREEQEELLSGAGFAGDIGRAVVGEGFTVLSVQK
jgi:SAM-dependent methyltransferase